MALLAPLIPLIWMMHSKILCKLEEDTNLRLNKEPSPKEVYHVVKEMHPTKAPRSDDFHALFFQKLRDIVGSDVVIFVRGVWRDKNNIKHAN